MRILCISPFFPPIRDSEAFCGGKMILALAERGCEVTVLYMSAAYLESKQDDSRVWRLVKPYSLPVHSGTTRQRARAAWNVLRYRISIWPRWVDNVVRVAGQLHDASPFDLIYSRSLPMFAHAAGYWTARTLRRPWIANINDPWDEHLFPTARKTSVSPFYAAVSGYWLKKTLTSANVVTFPSRRLAAFTTGLAGREFHGQLAPHVGWRIPSSDLEGPEFRLVHAGKLGTNEITGRSTHALLRAWKAFLEAEPRAQGSARLVLVGPEDPQTTAVVNQFGLGPSVRQIGQVNYETSLRHIGDASACLLIEAPMSEGVYLPSKLADYLVAQKPVLALSPKTGVIADLAQEQGLMRIDQSDQRAIEDIIARLFRAHFSGQLSEFAPASRLVEQFRGETIAAGFLQTASGLLEQKGTPPTRLRPPKSQPANAAKLAPTPSVSRSLL